MLYSETLNKQQPFGTVYHGSGEVADVDKACRFMQNGLYYDANGKMLDDHPHNAQRLELLRALKVKPEALPEPPKRSGNPDTVAKIAEMDDETVYQTACNLKRHLQEQETVDDFEPTEDNRMANEDFILKYV